MHKDCTFQPNHSNSNGIDVSILSEKLFKEGEQKKEKLKSLMDEKLNKDKEV